MSPGHDLSLEMPLLLDPCHDDPKDFLTFDLSGAILSLEDNPRGQATIAVFHLNRRRLRDLRRGVIDTVIELLNLLAVKREEISPAARADLWSWLQRCYLSEGCNYTAVARAVLQDPAAFGMLELDLSSLLASTSGS
jgi:hypothetical protein